MRGVSTKVYGCMTRDGIGETNVPNFEEDNCE